VGGRWAPSGASPRLARRWLEQGVRRFARSCPNERAGRCAANPLSPTWSKPPCLEAHADSNAPRPSPADLAAELQQGFAAQGRCAGTAVRGGDQHRQLRRRQRRPWAPLSCSDRTEDQRRRARCCAAMAQRTARWGAVIQTAWSVTVVTARSSNWMSASC